MLRDLFTVDLRLNQLFSRISLRMKKILFVEIFIWPRSAHWNYKKSQLKFIPEQEEMETQRIRSRRRGIGRKEDELGSEQIQVLIEASRRNTH